MDVVHILVGILVSDVDDSSPSTSDSWEGRRSDARHDARPRRTSTSSWSSISRSTDAGKSSSNARASSDGPG